MDILDFMEREVAETWKTVNGDFMGWQERMYKAVTALTGAGGAVAAYALGKATDRTEALVWAPIGTLGVCWMVIAGYILVKGMRSVNLPDGATADSLGTYYHRQGGNFAIEPNEVNALALVEARMQELRDKDAGLAEIRTACNQRALVLNRAYRAIAATPVLAAGVALGCYIGPRL